ncbi:MAG: GNAT family N-acetyltransferase [Rhizobiales bacterium]|nr:GNAT family N-acetyltransferase [Hyphomicrobiales bacterium]NRB13523.1 GNAT family N-acetyltransferase [Hyphomicrobiales bacterium]
MFSDNKFLTLAKQPIIGQHIYIRMAEKSDYPQFFAVRRANQQFLQPFEPIWAANALSKKVFYARVRNDQHEAGQDRKYGFLIFENTSKTLVGGVNINNVQRGVFQACSLGYWMAESQNSKGYMTEAVTLITDKCFKIWGFNRVQAATLLGNIASIRVLEKCGFEAEGEAKRYLKINGQWQDHRLFAKIAQN